MADEPMSDVPDTGSETQVHPTAFTPTSEPNLDARMTFAAAQAQLLQLSPGQEETKPGLSAEELSKSFATARKKDWDRFPAILAEARSDLGAIEQSGGSRRTKEYLDRWKD